MLIPQLLLFLFLLAKCLSAQAFESGSDGSDGDLDLTFGNITLQPRQLNLDRDRDNIFKFRDLIIPSGRTLTIRSIDLHRVGPVHILASRRISIAGTISIQGEDGVQYFFNTFSNTRGIPGPGGYPGGTAASDFFRSNLGTGWLPEFSSAPESGPECNASHSFIAGVIPDFATVCGPQRIYGYPTLNPLTGGSGGGAFKNARGGAGGGAIRLRAPLVEFSGLINAYGGNGYKSRTVDKCSGAGSGGSVLIQANNLALNGGLILIRGGECWDAELQRIDFSAPRASPGRYRIEANARTGNSSVFSTTPGQVNPEPVVTFPLTSTPHNDQVSDVRITRIQANNSVDFNPNSFLGNTALVLSASLPRVQIRVETKNVPVGSPIYLQLEALVEGKPAAEPNTWLLGFVQGDYSNGFVESEPGFGLRLSFPWAGNSLPTSYAFVAYSIW